MSRVTEKDIRRAAQQAGIPYNLFAAVIGRESGGKVGAVSSVGARGAAQLMPGTAKGLEQRYKIDTATPYGNLLGGAYYLKEQKERFGTWRKALAAYNAGPGAVEQYGGVPPYKETQDYVSKILGALPAPKPASNRVGSPTATPGSPQTIDPLAQSSMEGLRDLAEGDYDPRKALGGLQELQTEAKTAKVATAAPRPSQRPSVQVQGKVTPSVRKAGKLIQDALGTPYVWGAEGPDSFDCSGLLQYAWGKAGVQIPRVTYDQWRSGAPIPKDKLRYGDAVFFRMGERGPEHVGFYVGGGRFIEAPGRGKVVRVSKLAGRKDYAGGRRFT